MDVYVTGLHGSGPYGGSGFASGRNVYVVTVDGSVRDTLVSTDPLTNSQLVDIARGYREGLTGTPAA